MPPQPHARRFVPVSPTSWPWHLAALLALLVTTATPASPPAALLEAAAGGDADAQASLGSRLYRGEGMDRDVAGAFTWLRRAAEQGSPSAQLGLVVLYYNGEGTPQNLIEALKWALIASDQGDPEAIRHRDYLRNRLAPFQVREAERLAAAWTLRPETGTTR